MTPQTFLVRDLEDQQEDEQEEDIDLSWLSTYSLKFRKCLTIDTFKVGYNNKNNEDNENDKNDEENQLTVERLIRYNLCPSSKYLSKCSSNGSGEYVTKLSWFLDSYVNKQREDLERECEAVAEDCACENDDDDGDNDEAECLEECYNNMGMFNCLEDGDENDNGFEVEEYIDCKEMEIENDDDGDDDDDGEGIQFFIGPKCSANGRSIELSVFSDEYCTNEAPEGTYERYNGGAILPYSSSSSDSFMKEDFVSCLEDYQEEKEGDEGEEESNDINENVNEMCQTLYKSSARCEAKISSEVTESPDMSGCQYIHKMLPRQEHGYHEPISASFIVFVLLAIFFALLSVLLIFYILHLRRRAKNKSSFFLSNRFRRQRRRNKSNQKGQLLEDNGKKGGFFSSVWRNKKDDANKDKSDNNNKGSTATNNVASTLPASVTNNEKKGSGSNKKNNDHTEKQKTDNSTSVTPKATKTTKSTKKSSVSKRIIISQANNEQKKSSSRPRFGTRLSRIFRRKKELVAEVDDEEQQQQRDYRGGTMLI